MRLTASRRPPRTGRAHRSDELVALTADVLAVAVAAGLTPYLALETAVAFESGVVAERLEAILAAVAGGRRLVEALDDEVARSPALAPVLTILAATERSGAAAGPALGRLSAAIRAQARRRALARARTVPVRLLFPLVFLVLPAFLVLTVAPVVLASVR